MHFGTFTGLKLSIIHIQHLPSYPAFLQDTLLGPPNSHRYKDQKMVPGQ
jgi:hypothetical protein